MAERTNDRWLADLRALGSARERAVADLRRYIRGGLARALRGDADAGPQDVDDFTQDALVRILGALDSFRGESQFTTWAMTIALRVAYTALRKRRTADVSLADIEGYAGVVGGASLAEPNGAERRLERDDLLEALRGAIAERLTDRQRTVILAELQGIASDRVAELLGSNRNAVYKMYYDARRNLRSALIDAGFTASDIGAVVAGAE